MPTYTYSGLHPREGTIPVHTFYPADGGKPVVAMKSSIVIDGQSLQKTQLKEATFMLDAFQHFHISDMYRTNQDYDYALLVENLENASIPAKLVELESLPLSTYIGIIIDYNPRENTYTVGCGPYVFTNVVSDFSCTDPSSEFSSVKIQTRNSYTSNVNICDYEVEITCMMDCLSNDLSPSSSCSNVHDTEQCIIPAAMMSLEQAEASCLETLESRPNCKASVSSASSLRDESVVKVAEYSFPHQPGKRDHPTLENESPSQVSNSSCTAMSLEDFEALKPTIPSYEIRHKALFDEQLTVTIQNKSSSND